MLKLRVSNWRVLKQHLKGGLQQRLATKMAKSKFEYVKSFETEDRLDPGHWIVIALRLCNYDQLNETYLKQPNDSRFRCLIEDSVNTVMKDFKEIVVSYGFRGEISFVFKKCTTLYKRRGPKLLTNLSSLMASSFVHMWPKHFHAIPLNHFPMLEGAIHLLPTDQGLRDYLSQQQLACHYSNLYITVFWALVLKCDHTPDEVRKMLKGTSEGDKNEILFSRCNMNYNKEPSVYKKGTVFVRKSVPTEVLCPDGSVKLRNQSKIISMHTDFVKESFWMEVFVLDQPTKVNAKAKYLKAFEKSNILLPHSWIVVRIDGKGFHKFSEKHYFTKPNDIGSLKLMNIAAHEVMRKYPDIVLSYGQSDEYSFVIDRYSKMMDRQGHKIMSTIVSLFAAVYVSKWSEFFTNTKIKDCPAFDARVVLYPNNSCLRDYLSWRQVDCHINNLYNTCFWSLVQSGKYSRQQAEERLCGTFSKDKRAILKDDFCLDYDEEDAIYRKGTVMYSCDPQYGKRSDMSGQDSDTTTSLEGSTPRDSASSTLGDSTSNIRDNIVTEHVDFIREEFWAQRPWILGVEKCATLIDDLD